MKRFLTLSLVVFASTVLAEESAPTEGERLHSLFEKEWQLRVDENPGMGDDDDGERDWALSDASAEAVIEETEKRRAILEELATIDPDQLSQQDRISYFMFERQLEDMFENMRFRTWEIPFNTDSSFYAGLAFIPRNFSFRDAESYENYLERLESFPRYFDQQIENMRAGLARGATQPREILGNIEPTISVHVPAAVRESVFYAPFAEMPESISKEDQDRLRNRAVEVVRDDVIGSFARLRDFWVEEYLPQARTTLGATDLPNGKEWYQYLVSHYTTLDKTPEEIHAIGLSEVERIRGEMESIIEETGFEGSYAEFLHFLRTDPRFYAETPEELLKEAAWICKRMDGALPALFGRLPRQPYTVEPVPAEIAPRYTAGRYVGAGLESHRAGAYWVNTHDLDSRPLYTLEALSLHEAVPGHHLQGALSKELEDLPKFRRYTYLSAFGEGWGLYSEWLGLEAGFYDDPYSNFGRLTYEMWRACRLVVDTGVHALGWSRDQAVEFLASNTALSLHEVNTEIDRYISWPAQALSYKMGEIEIRRLRAKAEAELGDEFDVREFHDAVLENGSIPLPVLADQIDRFIQKTLEEAASETQEEAEVATAN